MAEKRKDLSTADELNVRAGLIVQQQRIEKLTDIDTEIGSHIAELQRGGLSIEQDLDLLLKAARKLADFQGKLETTLESQSEIDKALKKYQ